MSFARDTYNEPRLDHVSCISPSGLHRMAYWEWGDPENGKVLLCVHGLTRTGRDFDTLARALSSEYRVVCPDLVGRGQSSWLRDPAYYAVPQYTADMLPLIARVRASTLHWVGTSLGGLIGMSLASLADTPITRLVLNDVGPRLDPDALARISRYVGTAGVFASQLEGLAHLREVAAAFGPHTDEQWLELNRHIVRQTEGGWSMHYDPSIAIAFKQMTVQQAAVGEAMLWQAFECISCPILVLRGAQSDLLSRATAEQMLARNPNASLVEIGGVGHAPTLMAPEQLERVADFLRS